MEELKIPTYRAKIIDSDEYVESETLLKTIDESKIFLAKDFAEEYNNCIEVGDFSNLFSVDYWEIDTTTMAIHFPNMIDSKGNKIFASLREDGKGGDRYYIGDKRLVYIALIHNGSLMGKQENTYGSLVGLGYAECKSWKVIGKQD